MMMRTAGGPAVSPIDFAERRRPMPRWMVLAICASVLAHGAVGAWLYLQRFEAPVMSPPDTAKPFEVLVYKRPKPLPVQAPERPQAPTTRVNPTPAPTTDTDVIQAPVVDGPLADGPVISVADSPVPESPGPVTPTPTPVPADPVIRNPSWISKPSGQQLMTAYPERALERGVGGVASLSCTVRADGGVAGCSVVRETPGGQGFGRAALGLTRWFRLSPRTVDGQAVEGARVSMDIRFNPPAD